MKFWVIYVYEDRGLPIKQVQGFSTKQEAIKWIQNSKGLLIIDLAESMGEIY